MSVKCMSWAWEIDGLKPSQKLVLLRLADHAQDDGICWPGKHHLAERCGISKRSVDTAISGLIELGLIRVKHRLNDHGQDTSNAYELQIIQADLFQKKHGGAEIAPQGEKEQKKDPRGGAIHDTDGGAIGGAVVAPEPYNHKLKATVGENPASQADFSDWKPAAAIVQRIKMMRPDITDEFLAEILPEFLTFAESHYRRDQLESKYLANANRQWFRRQNKSKQGPPKDPDGLNAWAIDNNAPPANEGEDPFAYRQRLFEWINAGRPDAPPETKHSQEVEEAWQSDPYADLKTAAGGKP